jgi:hypothetical protein
VTTTPSAATWAVRGEAGRLYAGRYPAATFGKWNARHIGGIQWRIEASITESDPYWLEHGFRYRAVLLSAGREYRLRIDLVMTSPVLMFDMEVEP